VGWTRRSSATRLPWRESNCYRCGASRSPWPCPATHCLAAEPIVHLPQLRDLPLRLIPREDNAAFHDLIIRACVDAGFDPLPGPAFTNVQDTLAEIGNGRSSWTVLYASAVDQVPVRRIAFRRLAGLTAHTYLAVSPGPPSRPLRLLLHACAAVG
jgi:LysR substrate binding domain